MNILVGQAIKSFLHTCFPGSFVLKRVNGLEGVVVTFDDGPHPENTAKILEILKQKNIKAIFFVNGTELIKYPELGEQIIEQGHIIGNHGFHHLNVKECTFKVYKDSIVQTENLLERLYQNPTVHLFRPPYSKFSVKLLLYILFSRYLLFNWTKDSRDSFICSPEELLEYNNNLFLENGDILLFHDDSSCTVKILPEILDYHCDKGVRFTLPDL